MNKWGIVFDSSCGYSKQEITEMGAEFVPFKIYYDSKEFDDGVDIRTEDIAEKTRHLIVAKTSAPSPSIIEDAFNSGLKKSEKLIVIPLSKNLSGMQNAMRLVASQEEYRDKVYVLDSKLFGNWIMNFVPKLIKWQKDGVSFEEVVKNLEDYNESTYAAVMIDDLEFLGAGGRISQSQARLGRLAGIKPVLVIKDGKIDELESYKVRTFKKGVDKICSLINDFIDDNNINKDEYYIQIPYVGEKENWENISDAVKINIPGMEINSDIRGIPRSIVLVYTGVNTTGIALVKKFI